MMLQKLVSLGFQRSITVDCREITVGRRFRNCGWLKKNLIFWFPDFRSIIHRFIAMNLRKSPQQVQQPKNCNCRKKKLNALVLEGSCMQSKSAVTTEVTIESYSCRLASILKDRYRNHWTSSRSRNRQNELDLNIYVPFFPIKWKVVKKYQP